MIWYVKEQGWHYENLHGPFESESEAKQFKLSNAKQRSKKDAVKLSVIARQELV